jgi:hypothetical protein
MTPLTRDDTEHGKMYYLATEVDAQVSLAMGTLESRERNIETVLIESARRQSEIERLNAEVEVLQLAEEGAKEAFGAIVQTKRDLEAKCQELQRNIQSANDIARKSILSKEDLLSVLTKVDKSNLHYGCAPEARKAIARANATE